MKKNKFKSGMFVKSSISVKSGGVVKGVILTVLGLALLVAVGLGIRYGMSIGNFLNKVTQRKEVKAYSVVVNESSQYNKIEDLSNKNLGFLKLDEKAGNAEQHLLEKVKFEANFYDDTETLTGVLTGNIVDAIVLESDRIEMLKEDAADKFGKTRVIYTFEIELDAENAEIVQKQVTKEPFLIYISGTDSRAGVHATARSDVNIVAVVNPSTAKILLVSIPRDMYVQLHGTTGLKDKLTHAGVYGINMSKTTIEDFLGVSIDYTLKVSFDTVVKVVDQIDGIEITSDTAMKLGVEGKNKTCEYVVGKQKVDGDCALRFARERKSYETGDRHRGENQMQVISAIIEKMASSRGYLLNVPTILDIAADSFETSLSSDQILEFVRMQITEGKNWQVESISVNGTGAMLPTYSMGANWPLYVMIPDDATVLNAQNKIKENLK